MGANVPGASQGKKSRIKNRAFGQKDFVQTLILCLK
jgi:hypothetical protein